MDGRKPLPAIFKQKTDHRVSKAEIKKRREIEEDLIARSFLRCPSEMSEDAKKEWRRLMSLYRQMDADILSDLDKSALMIYCEAYSIYKTAQRTWLEYRQVVHKNEEIQKTIDKAFLMMERQSAIMYKFNEQLCLTPIGRARMGMAKKDEMSELEKMMNDG